MYGAVSDEEGVTRLDNYLNLGYARFTGATLELLIYEVDREIDASQGTWDKSKDPGPHHHCLKAKYELIFDIIRNLGDRFAQLKECAKKEIAKLYYDDANIKDIPALQKHLLEKFEAKSVADLYNKDTIHVAGKKLPTHATKLKKGEVWTQEMANKFTQTWKAKAIPAEKEMEGRKKILELIRKLDENKDNNGKQVNTHPDYINLVKDYNPVACGFCFSQSCQTKFDTAKAMHCNGITIRRRKILQKT